MGKREKITVATCPICGKVYKGKYAGNAVAGCIGYHKYPYKGIAGTNAVANAGQTQYKRSANAGANAGAFATYNQVGENGFDEAWYSEQWEKDRDEDGRVVINNNLPQPVQPGYQPMVVRQPLQAIRGAQRQVSPENVLKYIGIGLVFVIIVAILADAKAFSGDGKGGGAVGMLGMASTALGLSKKVRQELEGWNLR